MQMPEATAGGETVSTIQDVNVTELIDGRPFSRLAMLVLIQCAIIILLDGTDSIAIGLTAPSIAKSIGVNMASFGPIFAIGQAGVMVGALLLGPLADRFGRKSMIIGAAAAFGVFTLLTAFCTSYEQLFVCRLLAGLGLGGVTPNAVALTSEYAPKNSRSAVVALMWAAFPLGGVCIGLMSSYLIPRFGWQSVLIVGGIVPLIVCTIALAGLPESLAFLATRGVATPSIRAILSRLAPDIPTTGDTRLIVDEEKLPGVPVRHLLSGGRAVTTLLLWIACFTSFLILIFIVSWIPALLRANGLSMAEVGFAIALNSIGSAIGSGSVGRVMDRFGKHRVLITTFCIAAMTTAALGFTATSFTQLAVVIALGGCFAGASQAGVIALAAITYPVAMRSTGIGWAFAAGRLGAVVGPLLGGVMLGWGWHTDRILMAVAVPALIGAAAIALLLLHGGRSAQAPPLVATARS
jgi:MFS transporter, AAHS family, 4-hydroxybenzoate transporter